MAQRAGTPLCTARLLLPQPPTHPPADPPAAADGPTVGGAGGHGQPAAGLLPGLGRPPGRLSEQARWAVTVTRP